MLTSYVLQYKLVGFNLPLAANWLVALRFHVIFLMNARKWEPLLIISMYYFICGFYVSLTFDIVYLYIYIFMYLFIESRGLATLWC